MASFPEPRRPLWEAAKRNSLRCYYEYEHFWPQTLMWALGLVSWARHVWAARIPFARWMLAWAELPAARFLLSLLRWLRGVGRVGLQWEEGFGRSLKQAALGHLATLASDIPPGGMAQKAWKGSARGSGGRFPAIYNPFSPPCRCFIFNHAEVW